MLVNMEMQDNLDIHRIANHVRLFHHISSLPRFFACTTSYVNGVAMGLPLPPVIANFVVGNFE